MFVRAGLVARGFFGLPVSVALASPPLKKCGMGHVVQSVWLPAYRFSFLPIYFVFLCLVACIAYCLHLHARYFNLVVIMVKFTSRDRFHGDW